MNSAETCRKNGWKAGDYLIGNEGYGDTVIKLTAVGEEGILAIAVEHSGEKLNRCEQHWTLGCRQWRKVER